ncbi:MAG: hypothetical protein QM725_06365 [Lacibacter sp.]
METQTDLLNDFSIEKRGDIEVQYNISVNKFVLLSVLTGGLYELWWVYKAWRFFKEKDRLDIMPAMRAIFSIFFLYSLFNRILDYSNEKGYTGNYSSGFLFIAFILSNLLAYLPDPFWLISLLSVFILLPPFKALNYAKQNSTEFATVEQEGFNTRQVVLILIGVVFWSLALAGLMMNDYEL